MPNPAERDKALEPPHSSAEGEKEKPSTLLDFALEYERLKQSLSGKKAPGEITRVSETEPALEKPKQALALAKFDDSRFPSPWGPAPAEKQQPEAKQAPKIEDLKQAKEETKSKGEDSVKAAAPFNFNEILPALDLNLGSLLPSASVLDLTKFNLKDKAQKSLSWLGDFLAEAESESAESQSKKNASDSPTEFKTVSGSWRRVENGDWQFYDKSGKVQESKYGKVTELTKAEDGSPLLKLENGRAIKEKADGSVLEYNKDGKLEKIAYKDGTSRKFAWEGNELVQMVSSSGEFNRARDKNGKLKDEWTKRGQERAWHGKMNLDEKSGDFSVASTTYKSDLTVESKMEDGSKQIRHPNKDLVKIDKNGLFSEIEYGDGSKRKFGWKENPKADPNLPASERYSLQTVTVTRDGKSYQHNKEENGKWSVRTYENGSWSKAKDETLSFELDKKTGSYSYTDSADGIKHIVEPGGLKKDISADGTELEYKNDVLTKARKGEREREFVWQDKKLVGVHDGIQGKNWTLDKSGVWQSDKGDKQEGHAFVSADGEFGFKKQDKSSVFKTDGSQYERIVNEIEKWQLDIKDGEVHLKAADGSTREFKTDKSSDIVSESATRDGKTESWVRQERLANGNYIWANLEDPSKKEERSSVKQADGKLSIEYPDGRKYESDLSGNEKLSNVKENWSIKYKNGQVSESRFPDGTIRSYKFDSPGTSPSAIEVKSPDGKITSITKIKDGQYNYKWPDGEMKWNVDFTVSRDGMYKYVDHDEGGKTVTRHINGLTVTENPKEKSRVEKTGSEVNKVEIDGKSVEVIRDENKNISELRDYASNTVYKKDKDGSWQGAALDEAKPFAKLDNLARSGDLVLDEKGNASFIDSDGKQIKQKPGEPGELVSSKEMSIEAALNNAEMSESEKQALKKAVLDHAARSDLDPKQKSVFQESLARFANRQDISGKEKAESHKHLIRLLESKSDKVFNAKEKAELAGQLIWHMANPEKNQQGGNPNCQVTVIRGKLLWEKPSEFARMMSDVIENGEFVTKDKSKIKLPTDCFKVGKGSEESSFPPEDGSRSWLGKLSDITCANIHWQRQTKTPQGLHVAAGTLCYRQDAPEGRKDTGACVWRIPGDGYMYKVNNSAGKVLEYPGLYVKDIADVYSQITGSKATSVLAHGRLSGGDGVKIVSKDDLHKFLSENKSGTHIAQIWTGTPWVWKDVPRFKPGNSNDDKDEEHVLLVKDYDPKTKTCCIDNSWSVKYDRFAQDRRISLDQLYKAMAKIE